MLNTFLVRFLTVFTLVAGLYAAACITEYPRASTPAILLAVASLGLLSTCGYLIFVQGKEEA
jgi:hypothetical protein